MPARGLLNPVHKALKKLTDDLTAVYEDPGPVQTRKRSTLDKSSCRRFNFLKNVSQEGLVFFPCMEKKLDLLGKHFLKN